MNFSKLYYITKWYSKKLVTKVTKRNFKLEKYENTKWLPIDEANKRIETAIRDGIPFMAGRFGANELNITWRADENNTKWEIPIKKTFFHLQQGAGFFPDDEAAALRFVKLMKKSTEEVDLLAVWNQPMEDYMIRKWAKNELEVCSMRGIEPFFSSVPWTAALKGKKVLVIHPFSETIKNQYENHELLFANKELLPKFELIVEKAVQTIAGNRDVRFNTWFDALDYMYEQAMSVEFDVAVLGCGAYGFPLAARIKKAGKIAIHMGGATQLLFGIKGKRWEAIPEYAKMFNEYWVRANEQPKNANTVEDGCYW